MIPPKKFKKSKLMHKTEAVEHIGTPDQMSGF